jgi:hypothetical protein
MIPAQDSAERGRCPAKRGPAKEHAGANMPTNPRPTAARALVFAAGLFTLAMFGHHAPSRGIRTGHGE